MILYDEALKAAAKECADLKTKNAKLRESLGKMIRAFEAYGLPGERAEAIAAAKLLQER